jgi:hypothetical protein
MSSFTMPCLPSTAYCPRVDGVHQAEQQARIWERAVHLFDPEKDGQDPNHVVDIGYTKEYVGEGVFLVQKPIRGYDGDYTPRPYRVHVKEQTCTCPFFTGIIEGHWEETFQVTREGSRIVITKGQGAPITPDQTPKGFCKHVWGVLYALAQEEA